MKRKISIILLLQILIIPNFVPVAFANDSISNTSPKQLNNDPNDTTNPTTSQPDHDSKDSPRGACSKEEKEIIPLVPKAKVVYTILGNPKVFFYVPEGMSKNIKFSLSNEDEGVVYQTTFDTPNQAGIISVELASVPEKNLQIGKQYKWVFQIVCNENDPSGNPFIEGVIERKEISQDLSKNQLWYDALLETARLHRSASNDPKVTQDWEVLLDSLGFKAIAKEPFVEVLKK